MYRRPHAESIKKKKKKATEFKGGASSLHLLKPSAGATGSSFHSKDSFSLEIKTFRELVAQGQMTVSQGTQKIKVRTGLWCILLNRVHHHKKRLA